MAVPLGRWILSKQVEGLPSIQELTGGVSVGLRVATPGVGHTRQSARLNGVSVLRPNNRVCRTASACRLVSESDITCACRKSNPNILVMQPAQDWKAKNTPCSLNRAR